MNPTEVDPTDPYLREAQTFPRLTDEMSRRVAAYGVEEEVDDGSLLFERGQRTVDFFLVTSGAVETSDTDARGVAHLITTHGAGQFTGEMDMFNDRRVLVSARARGPSRVVRVGRTAFRRLVSAEPDVGEVILRAFILRRVGFIRHAEGGVILVGSRHGSDTQRLVRFMVSNGYPHRVVDTEDDQDFGICLDHFHVTADQLPVLILPGEVVLRNTITPAHPIGNFIVGISYLSSPRPGARLSFRHISSRSSPGP